MISTVPSLCLLCRPWRCLVLCCLVAVCLCSVRPSSAAETACNDADLFGSTLITGICWTCMLPLRVMGGSLNPDDPPDANSQPLCMCQDALGVPRFGITFGAWMPYRLFETTRMPFCSPALGGIYLNDDYRSVAGVGNSADSFDPEGAFHVHVYSFPLLTMLELVTSKQCNPGGYADMDLMLMSELDPIEFDGLLAMFVYPETAMFSNPLATASCAFECASLFAGVKPTSVGQYWCIGCYGNIYPLTFSDTGGFSPHGYSRIFSARYLAVKHRRGMGHITYGTDNMCGGQIWPFLPKEQYKWSQVFPLAEANPKCCTWTGTSEFQTGMWRNVPVAGEDMVQLLWRYTDCCMY